jgi:hypothetical protein
MYWGPVDSLVPVRLVDMREEPPSPAEAARRRVRALDVAVGGVGAVAVAALVAALSKHEPRPHAARRPTPAQTLATSPATPPPVTTPAQAATPTPVPATAETASVATPTSVPATAETASVATAVPVATVSSSVRDESAPPDVSQSAPPQPNPRKRRRLPPPGHAPPTASFPD